MLNQRERRALTIIESRLAATDPLLDRHFAQLGHVAPQLASRSRRAVNLPCPLLAAGLALLAFGALTATVSVIVTGIGLATLSLGVAFTAALAAGRPPSSAPSTLGGTTDGVGMADPVRIDAACSLDGVAAHVPRILGWDPSRPLPQPPGMDTRARVCLRSGLCRIAPDLGESCSATCARRTARTTS